MTLREHVVDGALSVAKDGALFGLAAGLEVGILSHSDVGSGDVFSDVPLGVMAAGGALAGAAVGAATGAICGTGVYVTEAAIKQARSMVEDDMPLLESVGSGAALGAAAGFTVGVAAGMSVVGGFGVVGMALYPLFCLTPYVGCPASVIDSAINVALNNPYLPPVPGVAITGAAGAAVGASLGAAAGAITFFARQQRNEKQQKEAVEQAGSIKDYNQHYEVAEEDHPSFGSGF